MATWTEPYKKGGIVIISNGAYYVAKRYKSDGTLEIKKCTYEEDAKKFIDEYCKFSGS